ncbi:MAG: SDR family oxidoreductase [Clostridiales bacterium]|nr:SDR family oxidoreductase [Clostridiales bacterium]
MSKYALVTGASRGIGKAIAEMMAAEGYNLYLSCINSKDALFSQTYELSRKYGVSCTSFIGDMGNEKDVQKMFDGIHELDVLINNAGVSYVGLLSEMSTKDWQKIMSANLDSIFYTCRLAIPLMLHKHKGKIINISSVWGNTGASMEVAYSAAKGAVNSFTKALAKELAPSLIQVNAVACGVIDTDMNRGFSDEEMEALRQEIPCDRIGQPAEAAQMVRSLLYAPEYLTGQVITMDGGWT